jgi:superfamily II DNA/RNA helicase
LRIHEIIRNFPFKTWNGIGVLSEEITKALVEMKFSSPTEIQKASIPVSVFGKCDILGAAPTGSGKTLGEPQFLLRFFDF